MKPSRPCKITAMLDTYQISKKFLYLDHIFAFGVIESRFFTADILASFSLPYQKSSSPQRPREDIRIISSVFRAPMISKGFGKILAIRLKFPEN
jgi:hypothetical protein